MQPVGSLSHMFGVWGGDNPKTHQTVFYCSHIWDQGALKALTSVTSQLLGRWKNLCVCGGGGGVAWSAPIIIHPLSVSPHMSLLNTEPLLNSVISHISIRMGNVNETQAVVNALLKICLWRTCAWPWGKELLFQKWKCSYSRLNYKPAIKCNPWKHQKQTRHGDGFFLNLLFPR